MKLKATRFVAVNCLLVVLAGSADSLAQEQGTIKPQTKSEKAVTKSEKAEAEGKLMTPEPKATSELIKLGLIRPDTVKFVDTRFAFGALVKGTPYSATAVTETVQTLSDGNDITRRIEARVYRDSQGRTRREQVLDSLARYSTGGDALRMIFIYDPVAGCSITLDPRTHVALRTKQRSDGSEWFKVDSGAKISERLIIRTTPVPVAPKPGDTAAPVPVAPKPGDTTAHDLKVSVDTANRLVSVRNGLTANQLADIRASEDSLGKSSGERVVGKTIELLGNQPIDGIEAEGSRSTEVIPAGQIGNRLPIEITQERWYSRELQVLVLTKHHDPRSGDITYRLTNIERSEPDPSLFEVPADYRLAGFEYVGSRPAPPNQKAAGSSPPKAKHAF
jgi:hypothetical protein